MLDERETNRLLEAMYLVSEMLRQANFYNSQIQNKYLLLEVFPEGSQQRSAREKDYHRVKEKLTGVIKSLPKDPKYKYAIPLLQQHTERPGLKEMLEKVYEIYPDLNPEDKRKREPPGRGVTSET